MPVKKNINRQRAWDRLLIPRPPGRYAGGMNYRMICIDLDGTLLNSTGSVSPDNIQAVHEARQAGLQVVICTGRGLAESRRTLDQLKHDAAAVLASGAHICDPATGLTLHRQGMAAKLAHDVATHLRKATGLAVLALLDHNERTSDYLIMGGRNLSPNTQKWFASIQARIHETETPAVTDFDGTLRMGVVGPGVIMPKLMKELNDRFGDALQTHHFHAVGGVEHDIHVLEVFGAGVHKWSGIQWLAKHHGVEESQIAAIGDHINDLTMIQSAGLGVAMGNAVPSVTSAARQVTHDNNNHGVAHAIRNILDGTW